MMLKRRNKASICLVSFIHISALIPTSFSSPFFWRQRATTTTKLRHNRSGLHHRHHHDHRLVANNDLPTTKKENNNEYDVDHQFYYPGLLSDIDSIESNHHHHHRPSGRRRRHHQSSNMIRIWFEKFGDFVTHPKVLSGLQYSLLAYIIWETVRAARQVFKEIIEESDEYGVGGLSTSSSADAILSANSARKIVLWLEEEDLELRGDPPSVSPRWMLSLAQNLKSSCHSITGVELYRILLNLTKPQAVLLQSALLRPSKKIAFDSVGGLSLVKKSIQDWIGIHCCNNASNNPTNEQNTTPFHNFVSEGRQGIVLWGPPGCGKSLLIQAMANASGLPTLIVTPSLLQRKWFGESTNQVRTLFGLASLLGRCTIVLDELDGLFRVRSREEHDATRELKTEWLQWWDGAAAASSSSNLQGHHRSDKVTVVAATNRPWDVDGAFLRRCGRKFYVGIPTWDERCDLVHKVVESYGLPMIHPTVIEYLADSSEGYTPSDLFQILQCACRKGPMTRNDTELTVEDIQQALNEVPPTRFPTQYIQQIRDFLGGANNNQAYQQDHHHQQQQQYTSSEESAISFNPDKPRVFQTPMGNFYEFNIPVDSDVFDIMEEYLWTNNDYYETFESSDDESIYEEESEDDYDDL